VIAGVGAELNNLKKSAGGSIREFEAGWPLTSCGLFIVKPADS
jgi:hypothetical protein